MTTSKKRLPEETMAGCGHFCSIPNAPKCPDCVEEYFLSIPDHARLLAILFRQATEYNSQPVDVRGDDLFHLNLGACMGECVAGFFRDALKKKAAGVR